MAKFLITYTGGQQPEGMSEEETGKVMAAWQAWYGRLGDAVVDLGNPTGPSKVVGPDCSVSDGGPGITGYSLISADSLDAAAAACAGHPHTDAGGTITVSETFDVM
jgi:hypothetical protein